MAVFASLSGLALSGGSPAGAKSAVVSGVTPIKRVTCPERSGTQAFFGKLRVSVSTKPLWLMSADVDCGQWSGKSNPTKFANVGPFGSSVEEPGGLTNPFRLEVGSAVRPRWRMRLVKKSADGQWVKIFSFKLAFAPWPGRTGYRGIYLCFTDTCDDIKRVRLCPSTDPKNIDCGFPLEAPRQITAVTWYQDGTMYRTPAVGGFKPFVIWTENWRNTDTGASTFHIHITESPRLG